jgi:hypothetical protein
MTRFSMGTLNPESAGALPNTFPSPRERSSKSFAEAL